MFGSPTPWRCGLIERDRLQRRDGCPNKLLDRISRVGTIGLATRQARDAFRRYQRVVERPEQEVAAPNDFGARNVRQALMDRIDKGMTGVVKSLRDNSPRDFVSFGRRDRAEPRETRSPARKITARGQRGQHIAPDERLQSVLA